MTIDIFLDVNVARLSHVQWEQELEHLVQGGKAPQALQSHEDCALGRWIYGRGLATYAKNRDLWALKEAHKEFHHRADEVVTLMEKGDTPGAKAVMERIGQLSREVVYRLTGMELAVLQRDWRSRALLHPGRMLDRLMGRPASHKMFPMIASTVPRKRLGIGRSKVERRAILLDANAARLTHVMWIQDLEHSFRHRGKGVQVQPAEECDLGVWIHGEGHDEFGSAPEFLALDQKHKEFHRYAQKTIASLSHGEYQHADTAYQHAIQLSQEIVVLLTRIELNFEDAKSLSKRIRSLL
ncbi:MAG: CZB domain-containing protein [Alphaproteobacteria bacterium]|nr:CZB domain-containing protein [Alphaproteobacteria bacterium]MBF0249890.1 CZB domain-containing protein [Alphaproteobacteria bacterium]